MNKPKIWALLLLVRVVLLGVCAAKQPTVEPAMVDTIYLPVIGMGPKPALKGVALTGPRGAVGQLEAQWYYNWSWKAPTPDPLFVPMIWGKSSMKYLTEAASIAKAGSGWLLGFNEPDIGWPWGCNIDPAEGAVLWHEIEQQAAGVLLVSPTPSQEDFDWLWRMVAAYEAQYGSKPRFNAIGVHWYNWQNPASVQPAKDHLLRVRAEALAHGYDVPLWLTEFAGHVRIWDPAGGHLRLMEELIPWMWEQSWIARYAWFATHLTGDQSSCLNCQPCSLTDPETGQQLTILGESYKEIE
jgi:hypothetical protein